MKYSNVEWTIGQLMDLINCNRINLRPPYQRNFIWSPKDQKLLIESLHKALCKMRVTICGKVRMILGPARYDFLCNREFQRFV